MSSKITFMAPNRNDQEEGFGTGTPEGPPGISTKGRLTLVFILGTIATMFLLGIIGVVSKGVERDPPEITVPQKLGAITNVARTLHIVVDDKGTGLDHVSIILRQGSKILNVADEELGRRSSFAKTFTVDVQTTEFVEGSAELIIQATDDTVWHNRASRTIPLLVDTSPPTIEILSKSETLIAGGTGMVFYRATDKSLGGTGIRVGQDYYPGIPAHLVDADIEQSDVFVSIYPVGNDPKASVVITAVDAVDNETTVPVKVSISPRPVGARTTLHISTQGILKSARTILVASLGRVPPEKRKEALALVDSAQSGDRNADREIFNIISTTLKSDAFAQIRDALKDHWQESHLWEPKPAFEFFALKYRFGDKIEITDDFGPIGTIVCEGDFLEAIPGYDVIVAPFAGTVRIAQTLSLFGSTVVVDHGAGVASMFYAMDHPLVDFGSTIRQGQKIGTIGSSGLSFGNLARVTILVQGVPVDPRDWFDHSRFLQRIQPVIDQAKGKLGIPIKGNGREI